MPHRRSGGCIVRAFVFDLRGRPRLDANLSRRRAGSDRPMRINWDGIHRFPPPYRSDRQS